MKMAATSGCRRRITGWPRCGCSTKPGTVGAVHPEEERAWDNLLIRGDALNALTSLIELPEFARDYVGKVKLAYLDPPFNTQQSFLQYDDALEHSVWLTMMRDRLAQIKTLLAPDGSVWVHCDDSEQAYLKVMMDELFGRECFVATIVWERRYTQSSDATISVTHDYLLVYAMAGRDWKLVRNALERTEKQNRSFSNPDNDPRGSWLSGSLISPNYRRSGDFTITAPNGKQHTPEPGTSWRYPKETYEQLTENNRIWFGMDGNGVPRTKRFLSEMGGVVPKTWWPHEDAGHTDMARREIRALVPDVEPFKTPKPEKLIQRIIHIGSNPGDIVLDCFLGSGTTAAVAHKMGRRWVGIEREQETLATYAIPRLGKVVNGDDPGGITKEVEWQGGGSFRILDVAPSMFAEVEGQVYLSEWATNGVLAEATAAQLNFDYRPEQPFSGVRGRTRLAVLDGLVSEDAVRLLVGALEEDERLVVCGTALDPAANTALRELRPGSSARKIPQSILAEYQQATRWRPDVPEAGPPKPAQARLFEAAS